MSKHLNGQTVVTLCLLVLLVVNMIMMAKLILHVQKSPSGSRAGDMLPCKALPTRFVIEEPDCADRLLTLMTIQLKVASVKGL